MPDCPDLQALAESKLDRILTQYRESPKLLGLIRNFLLAAAQAGDAMCAIPPEFDLDISIGEQLTWLGKALGWPRCHCRGSRLPVFGFACDDACYNGPPIGGFCEAEWSGCPGPTHFEYCFVDDEFYRRFLKARVLALTNDYRRPNLQAALDELFGEGDSRIAFERPGEIHVQLNRLFEGDEPKVRELFREVLPVAYGVRLNISQTDTATFGFGLGYGGFCDSHFINL